MNYRDASIRGIRISPAATSLFSWTEAGLRVLHETFLRRKHRGIYSYPVKTFPETEEI